MKKIRQRVYYAIGYLITYIIAYLVPARIMAHPHFFALWERRGYHITPVHYYQPVPDTRTLSASFQHETEMVGIDMQPAVQLDLLKTFMRHYKAEYDALPQGKVTAPHQFTHDPAVQTVFRSGDVEMLYAMVRHYKPAHMIEIGSGMTTRLSAQALLKNAEEGYPCNFTAIEPYPDEVVQAGFPGLTRLIPDPLQAVPLAAFMELQANDILFIDSTHVLKIGSDVQYEYLEILPRLNKGVIIHIHDIFLPQEYPADWLMKKRWFWTEAYLLQAFLTYNQHFEVLWAGAYMHLKYPNQLQAAFAAYDPTKFFPASFWIRKIK